MIQLDLPNDAKYQVQKFYLVEKLLSYRTLH